MTYSTPTARDLGIKHDGVYVVSVVNPHYPFPMPAAGKAETTFEAAEARAREFLAKGYLAAWVVSRTETVEVTA
jgi:hypothetical protein